MTLVHRQASLGSHPRLGAGRHRAGGRVRLRRDAGLPRAAGRGRPDDPRQLQPGDDHDRPPGRRRDLSRAAHRRGRRGRDRQGAARGAPGRARRPDRAQPGDGPRRAGDARAVRRQAARHAADGDRDGRGSRARSATCSIGSASRTRRRRSSRAPRRPSAPASADKALADIGLPAIVRPAFTLGGTGGGIVETEPAYRERVRAGLRASPIGQVMVEQCLVGWQEIEYEVMRDADDTCIAVCSMENVDPLGVHTGDSIVVAPVQTLPDPVHQRLRSAALAIIRALGVEGGCNVQFALSPDSTEYAVIEVNPRVSRSSALASKATGYPIARVAAQIAIGRRLAEIPNVVTGTTVAAFEPALDYVVVKLPRFPFDKFPGADRTLGSADEGDRRGDGDRPHVRRGAQQGAPRPRAGRRRAARRGPELDADVRLPGRRLRAATRRSDEPIRWVDEGGQACESTRHAQRSAAPIVLRRFLAPSDSRLWRLLGLLRRGVPGGDDPGGDRDRAVVPRRDGPQRRARGGRARGGRADRRTRADADAADAPGHGQASRLRGPRARRRSPGWRTRRSGTRASARPATRATRWSTRVRPSSRPRPRTSTRPTPRQDRRRRRHPSTGRPPSSSAAARSGSGRGSSSTTARSRPPQTLRERGWPAVMINSNPETVSTDFDASSRLYFEPLDPESVRSVIDAETPRRRGAPPRRRRVRRPDAAQPRGAPRGRRRPAARQRPRGDRPGRGADAVLGPPRPARHPAARRRDGPQRRGGADAGRADRLPGHRAADVRDRRSRDRLLLLAGGPGPAARRRDGRRPGPAGPDRPLPRRRRGRRRRDLGRPASPDPRAARARRAGRRPQRRLGRRLPAADGREWRPGADRRHDGADRARARCARAWSTPSSSSATTASTSSRSTRGPRGPCRS